MSVDELAGWTSPAANVTTPTSLIFSENRGMVSLDTIRASNLEAGNFEDLVAVFGMFSRSRGRLGGYLVPRFATCLMLTCA